MKRIYLFVGIIFLISLIACKDDDDKTNNNPTNEPFSEYPVKLGNKWNYERIWQITNYDSLPLGVSDSLYSTITYEITQEVTLNDTISAFEFVETGVEKDYQSFVYADNTDDGLITYGYIGGSNVKDSIMYEIPPVISLKYPLDVGTQWISKFFDDNPNSYVEKNVLQKQSVQVPAGIFSCYEVQRNVHFCSDTAAVNSIISYDYIANQGLIKREFYIEDIEVTDANGVSLGFMDFSEVSNLLSYNLN